MDAKLADPIIQVRDFAMRFGRTTVVRNLSFDVHAGEVFGFLGANGSGKTTTIRALLGIFEPSYGTLLVNGKKFDPADSSFLGYLPEERGLYKKEPVIETMIYFGRLKGMGREDARRWSTDYLESVDLGDKARLQLGSLSGGQQQKVQFGVTIMNDPALLILDEPTKGLDPLNRRLMLDIIHERVARGSTVVLVTHQMEEVERLCDRLILIKDGTRRLYGTVDEIRRAHGADTVHLQFKGSLPENPALYAVASQADGVAELVPADGVGGHAILEYLAARADLDITAFEVKPPSLDDVVVAIYREGEA